MTGKTEFPARVRVQRIVLWYWCIIVIALGTSTSLFASALALVPQQQQPQKHNTPENKENGSHWQIHRTIQHLQTHGMPTPKPTPNKVATAAVQVDFTSTAAAVIPVLELWAKNCAGKEEWRSLLNKRSLRHEVEESIVALHHLRVWRQQQQQQQQQKDTVSTITNENSRNSDDGFIAVDACCGKGVFSMLLCYLAAAPRSHDQLQNDQWFAGLSRIILLDKNQEINWDHIQAANANHEQEKRPFLELWPGTNLHEHDSITERLLLASSGTVDSTTTNINNDSSKDIESTLSPRSKPLAITGIHLCKTLSPALVGIVNALGKEKVPYLCLAPCCLPRTRDMQLSIPLYEGPMQRQARMLAIREKRKKQDTFACYVCGQRDHHVRSCPQRATYATESDWDQAVAAGILRRKVLGVDQGVAITYHEEQPRMLWDFGSVVTATPDNQQPFEAYCEALSKLVQQTSTVQVTDSGLISSESASRNKEIQKQVNNWNQNRKSFFITAIR
mmetsp:Transcript_28490/g.52607  ORF Transcript_28490/g.52607 Transcript_28490/m.52607 type:complete len:503 (-) Transcript_28490:28-1536(-)